MGIAVKPYRLAPAPVVGVVLLCKRTFSEEARRRRRRRPPPEAEKFWGFSSHFARFCTIFRAPTLPRSNQILCRRCCRRPWCRATTVPLLVLPLPATTAAAAAAAAAGCCADAAPLPHRGAVMAIAMAASHRPPARSPAGPSARRPSQPAAAARPPTATPACVSITRRLSLRADGRQHPPPKIRTVQTRTTGLRSE